MMYSRNAQRNALHLALSEAVVAEVLPQRAQVPRVCICDGCVPVGAPPLAHPNLRRRRGRRGKQLGEWALFRGHDAVRVLSEPAVRLLQASPGGPVLPDPLRVVLLAVAVPAGPLGPAALAAPQPGA